MNESWSVWPSKQHLERQELVRHDNAIVKRLKYHQQKKEDDNLVSKNFKTDI